MASALSTLLARRVFARNAAAAVPVLSPLSKRGFCNVVSVDSVGRREEGPSFHQKVQKITNSEEKIGLANDPLQYDVTIVGGGMVGLALACGLSSLPLTKHLKVAIIDPNPTLASRDYLPKDGVPDSRVSTVTPATISFFKDVGAWVHVQQQRHAFFDKMQVWDYTGLGYTRYNAKDVGKDYLGCVVENKVLCNSLLLCLQREDSAKTILPARLTKLTLQPKNGKTMLSGTSSIGDSSEQKHLSHLVKLELSDGQILYSKLVVGADGAKSSVREVAGIKTTGWNYSQSGLICTVEHREENFCAWQRFLPSGPIALLPIGDNYSNIVWTMNPADSERHKTMSEKEFVEAVNHALDHGYGPHPQPSALDALFDKLPWFSGDIPSTRERFELPPRVTNVVSERMAFPLSLMHAHEYASRRIVLIGDAAHTVHPLAGQGVNLGFGDASTLANIIAEGLSVGTDIGEIALLKRYEKQRKAANLAMMAILDGFQRAYSVDLGPVNVLRAAAFHGAQFIAPLKRNIISYAMGEQRWPLFA